jgi:hypothetical protein
MMETKEKKDSVGYVRKPHRTALRKNDENRYVPWCSCGWQYNRGMKAENAEKYAKAHTEEDAARALLECYRKFVEISVSYGEKASDIDVVETVLYWAKNGGSADIVAAADLALAHLKKNGDA